MATAVHSLNEPLAQISSELDECSLRVERLVEQGGERLWTAPAQGGWAVGQCIAHLTRTAEAWVPGLEEALQEAHAGAPPYKPTLTGRLLAWFLEPPYRVKFKATSQFTPRDRKLAGAELLGGFLAAQQEVQRALQLANGKAIDSIIIPSPIDARLRYDVYSAFRILTAHERRHLWQAQRILTALDDEQ